MSERKIWYKNIHGEASNPNSFSLGSATKKDTNDKTLAKNLSEARMWANQSSNNSADLNKDGVVDVFDLSILLSGWS